MPDLTPDLTPESVAGRNFTTVFRGFDREEVMAFLRDVSLELERAENDRRTMIESLQVAEPPDLGKQIDFATTQINELLQQARQVAHDMQERALVEADRVTSDTRRSVDEQILTAEEDAFALRRDAWNTASELLEQCTAHVTAIEDQARHESARAVGDAEREAHRIVMAARREREDAIRAARMEADEAIAVARARHDEIIESALRQSETAQERTRALESRRNELMVELDRLRALIDGDPVPDSADRPPPKKSEAPPVVKTAPAPSKSVKPADPPAASGTAVPASLEGWVPGETVRVVRPSKGRFADVEIVEAAAVPEIKLVSAEELAQRGSDDSDEPADEATGEATGETTIAAPAPESERDVDDSPTPEPTQPDPVIVSTEDFGVGESESYPPESQEVESQEVESQEVEHEPVDVDSTPTPGGDSGSGVLSEVAQLFRRLRGESTITPPDGDQSDMVLDLPTETEMDVDENASEDQDPVSRTERVDRDAQIPMRIMDIDSFELRDRFLLPVANQALRSIKRALVEEQNLALEELRLEPDEWHPTAERIGTRLGPELSAVAVASFLAGHQAAETLVGESLPKDSGPGSQTDEGFVEALIAALEQSAEGGRTSGDGIRQIGASVSKVFRVWRTDQADRRVRALASDRYHKGLVEAMRSAGHDHLAWRVAGRGCATCRQYGADRRANSVPPAHPECECTLAPLVSIR